MPICSSAEVYHLPTKSTHLLKELYFLPEFFLNADRKAGLTIHYYRYNCISNNVKINYDVTFCCF